MVDGFVWIPKWYNKQSGLGGTFISWCQG